jgi:multidrug resistance efflux pump
MQAPKRRRAGAIVLAVLGTAFVIWIGYRYWYLPTFVFVETTDAEVAGNVARIGAPSTGRVEKLLVDFGDQVSEGQRIAQIVADSRSQTSSQVTSPVAGQVTARWVTIGDTVMTGETMVSVTDLNNLWVVANVNEARILQVHPGQSVNVNIPALNETFSGQVIAVGSATTEVIDPPPTGSLTSDSEKKIPVQIAVNWTGAQAMPGMSADVIVYLHP